MVMPEALTLTRYSSILTILFPDGKWFTADDGLRVILGSPAIDAGYNDALPADSSDLDGDGNLTEAIPFDVKGFNRRQGSSVDIGAYESDPVFLIWASCCYCQSIRL